MKRIIFILLISFVVINNFSLQLFEKDNKNIDVNDSILISGYLSDDINSYLASNTYENNIENIIHDKEYSINNILHSNYNYNNKRNYNYLYYKNNEGYIITNKDDIKNAIYNGLNDGKDNIILYCVYNSNENCFNDFYSIYSDRLLMASISNYLSPYNRFSSRSYNINIKDGYAKIEVTFDKKYTEDEIKEINGKIDYYLSELDLNKMSEVEKIKWAHDFIINRNKYDNISINNGVGKSYSAYGALIGNKAVCQGYAEAMALLLDKFNIPNILISNETHIWNLVNVEGKWLHLDTTWDDITNEKGKQSIRYKYYLVSSSKLAELDSSNSHKFDSNYYLETLMN